MLGDDERDRMYFHAIREAIERLWAGGYDVFTPGDTFTIPGFYVKNPIEHPTEAQGDLSYAAMKRMQRESMADADAVYMKAYQKALADPFTVHGRTFFVRDGVLHEALQAKAEHATLTYNDRLFLKRSGISPD